QASTPDATKVKDKDAELEKRMEAIRKKNEAIMKRYEEIKQDKQRAEAEGMAINHRRKGRDRERFQPSKGASRQPSDRPSPPGAGPGATPGPPQAAGPGAGIGGPPRGVGVSERGGRGRGKRDGLGRGEKVDRSSKEWEERRRQNIEKMNEEMEQIAEYERGRRDGKVDKNPVRHFLDDVRRAGTYADQEGAERREGSRRHQRNWGGADFDRVKTGMEKRRDMERQQGGSDMSLSMTGRQRAEYSRWKEEREAIDRARLDRHKNASGEWRREWDAQKTDEMFKANQVPVPDGNDANFRDDHRRPPKNRNLGDFVSAPAASSPVKTRDTRSPGRERLTGRARNYSMHDDRWEETNDEQPSRAVDQAQVRASDPDRLEQAEGQNDDDDEWEDADEGDEDDGEEEVEAKQCEQRPKRTRNAPRLTLPERDPVLEGAERSPADDSASTASKPPTPYSPFSPGDGYQPVGDWGEAMEAASPQSDSPPRPAQPTDAA
uniref:Coiled-coil domain containing 9 n=1 Tax=Petromyzon marinus TaxID=7757 RepID=S4RAU3_PETMA